MYPTLEVRDVFSAFVAQIEVPTAGAFDPIFQIFLAVGTVVGIVVIGYMVYNAFKYRAGSDVKRELDEPEPGELWEDDKSGRKLFLSFGISAVIVLSLVSGTYVILLDMQEPPREGMDIDVTGFQWGWEFTYPNGHTTTGELRLPKGEVVEFGVTSRDVFHNFGIRGGGFTRKVDAIPGQTISMWTVPKETGTFEAKCYELCGVGHSSMTADVVVMPQDEFYDWYNTTGNSTE